MSGYIEQILKNNNIDIYHYDKIQTINKINYTIELISKNMIEIKNDKNIIEEFLQEYLNIDYDSFIFGIEENIITQEMIIKFLQTKPNKKELDTINCIINLKKKYNEFKCANFVNYTDTVIDNFITQLIFNYNLEMDLNFELNETPINYLKRTLELYNQTFNIDILKNKISSRYYADILNFHSLNLSKKIDVNEEIIKTFFDFLSNLYFDRDDGYKITPFELDEPYKPFETYNLDINTLFQNTKYQVNLFSFLEEQRTPNHKIRTDLVIIKKLFQIAKIFNLIGHKVIVIGSEFSINDIGQGYWTNTPYAFDDIYEKYLNKLPKLLFQITNIYLIVDFYCII